MVMDVNSSKKIVKGGLFIALEGIDGSGKSTQLICLKEKLEEEGYTVVITREPTEGYWGQKIRNLYSAKEREKVSAEREVDYFVQDRAEDVTQTIQPALEEGKIVITDRYFYSNIAYQGARGIPLDFIIKRNEHFPRPDIVFYFDISPEAGIERIQSGRQEETNAFEKLDYLQKVQSIFKNMPDRNIVSVEGALPIHELTDVLVKFVNTYLQKKTIQIAS